MRINEVILHEELLDVKSVITSPIKKLDKVFKSNNYELRVVGGAVRDLALDKTPKDIDLATDATPDEMMAILDKAGIRHIPSGLEHGTITAILDNEPYEITTLRADKETDGRHAEVEFVKSWEEDAKRRDLTYNAMSMDMEGNVFDYFGGMDDLQDKVSKFVGDPEERITEDYLRILRYFRFQGRLSTPTWDKDTLKAISSNAEGLQKISAERVWQEMGKVLSGNNVANILDYMAKTGVSKVIGLSTNDLNKVKDNGNSIVALAQTGNTIDIAKRWKLSKVQATMLDFLVKNKNNTLDQKKVEDMIADGVDKELISALATLQGKDVNIDAEVPNFPITGADLIAKGMKPGPEIGAKLGQLKQKWKDSNFKSTKDELLGESKLFEAVHRFMTGHGVTFAGKKHDEIEIEVTGTDNVNKKYIVTILAPKELFGKQTQISSKYMNRGPWTKTKVDNVFEATATTTAFNEAKDGLPVKTLKGLYHVGTLDASKKRDGFEGAGLSVSTHPDAWKQIARGHVTGDTHSATKEGNKFLDAHGLSDAHNEQIKQWALENDYLAQQETVTVCYYDDEMEDDLCSTFNSMADAEAEYDEELEHMDVSVDKGGIVPTDKLKKETRQNRIESTGVLEFVLPIFAEQQGLDGVWWQDKLDVNRYSAPRGVIVPSKIKSWKFAVNETKAFN